jgi:hypothetical protein
MTEFEAIKFLVEKEHQVEMDGTICVQMLGPMAEEHAGQYSVVLDEVDKEQQEYLFDTVDEAVAKYLDEVEKWTGGRSWFDIGGL